jgi:hypothetical protein
MSVAHLLADSRARVGNRTRGELAQLHSWVHSLEPEWWTTAITFQRGPLWIRLDDTRWRVQTSFYGTRWGWTRNSHVRYSVNIMLSPGDITRAQHNTLRRAGKYAAVTAALRKLGYKGGWHTKGGRFGLFSKDLRSPKVLKHEVNRLTSVSFKDLLGQAGRRTRR